MNLKRIIVCVVHADFIIIYINIKGISIIYKGIIYFKLISEGQNKCSSLYFVVYYKSLWSTAHYISTHLLSFHLFSIFMLIFSIYYYYYYYYK